MSFRAATRGSYRVSVSFNGQDIKGSSFEFRVDCVSAEKSYLEVPDLSPFPGTGKIDMKIVAVDQDGTPLKQGGDQFTASITINGQPQVSFISFKSIFLE